MAWTVVSELGKGKVKSSSSKGTSYNGIKSTLIIAPALLIIAGGVSAHDVSGIVYTDGSSFSNSLSGDEHAIVSGKARIVGANQPYAGSNGNITGTVTTDKNASSTHDDFGTDEINITNGATLIAQTTGKFDFDNKLVGDGALIADNNNGNFNFTAAAGDQFAGDVTLKNDHFALESTNTTALTNATLHIGSGNITTVGTGTQNIGGLNNCSE